MEMQRYPQSTAGVRAQVLIRVDETGDLMVENNVGDSNPWSKQGISSSMSIGFVSCVGPTEGLRTKVMNALTTFCLKGSVFSERKEKGSKSEKPVLLTADKPIMKLENGTSALFPLHIAYDSGGGWEYSFLRLTEFCLHVSTCVILAVNQDFIDSFSINLDKLIGDSKKLAAVIIFWDWSALKVGGLGFTNDLIGEETFKMQADTEDLLTAKAIQFLATFEPYFNHSFVCFPSSKGLEHALVVRKVKEVIENLAKAPSTVGRVKLRPNNFGTVVKKFVSKRNSDEEDTRVIGGRIDGKSRQRRCVSSLNTPRQDGAEETRRTFVRDDKKMEQRLEDPRIASGNVLEDRFKVMYLTMFHKQVLKSDTIHLTQDQVMSIHTNLLPRCESKILETFPRLKSCSISWAEFAQPLLSKFLSEAGKSTRNFEKLFQLHKTYFLDVLRYFSTHLINRGSSNTVDTILLRSYPDQLGKCLEEVNLKMQEYFNRLQRIFKDDLCKSEARVKSYQNLLERCFKEMRSEGSASLKPLKLPEAHDLNFSPDVGEVIGDATLLQRFSQSIMDWELKKAQGIQTRYLKACEQSQARNIVNGGVLTRDSKRRSAVDEPKPQGVTHQQEVALRVDKVSENMLQGRTQKNVRIHSDAKIPVYENTKALLMKSPDKMKAKPEDDDVVASTIINNVQEKSKSFQVPDVDASTVKSFYSRCFENAMKIYANHLFIKQKYIKYMHAVALKQCTDILLPNFHQVGLTTLENKIGQIVEEQLQENLKSAKLSQQTFHALYKECDSYFESVELMLKDKMLSREIFTVRDLCSDAPLSLRRKLKQVRVKPNVRDYFKERIDEFNCDIQNIVRILLQCRDSLHSVRLKSTKEAEKYTEYWIKTAVCLKICCKSREPFLKSFLIDLIQCEIDDIMEITKKKHSRRINQSEVSIIQPRSSGVLLEQRSGVAPGQSSEARHERSTRSLQHPRPMLHLLETPPPPPPVSHTQTGSVAPSQPSGTSLSASKKSTVSRREQSLIFRNTVPTFPRQHGETVASKNLPAASVVRRSATFPEQSFVASPKKPGYRPGTNSEHKNEILPAAPTILATPPLQNQPTLPPHPPSIKRLILPSVSPPRETNNPKPQVLQTLEPPPSSKQESQPKQQEQKPLHEPSLTLEELRTLEAELLEHVIQTYEDFMQTATKKSFYSDKNLSDMHERLKVLLVEGLSPKLDIEIRQPNFLDNLSLELSTRLKKFIAANQENVKLNLRKRQKVTANCIRNLHEELKKRLFNASKPDTRILGEAKNIAMAYFEREIQDENEDVGALWKEEAKSMVESYLGGDYSGDYGNFLDLNGKLDEESIIAEESPESKRKRVREELKEMITEMQGHLGESEHDEGPIQRYVRQSVNDAVVVLGDANSKDAKLKMTLEGLKVIQENLENSE